MSYCFMFRGDKWTDEKNDFFSSILPTRFDFHFQLMQETFKHCLSQAAFSGQDSRRPTVLLWGKGGLSLHCN